MQKRMIWLLALLAALLCVLTVSAGAVSGTCGDNLTWSLSVERLTISGRGAMTDYSSGKAPWYGYRNQIKSVRIYDGVTSVGDYAFNQCTSITDIEIPDSVTSVGNYAFSQCSKLTSVEIPNSVTSIGADAFSYCYALTSLGLGNGVTNIGEFAFSSCDKLTSVVIPDSVTTIAQSAFRDCDKLENVRLGSAVTNIGWFAFISCDELSKFTVSEKNPHYKAADGVLFDKNMETLIAAPNGKSGVYTIPDDVVSVGNYAFSACSKLSQIIIPNSVRDIGKRAFDDCAGLISIEIPDSVTTIGEAAFSWCSSLSSVKMGDGLTNIEDRLFDYCTKLSDVKIGKNVTSIGIRAFNDCSSLTNILIPDSVTNIDASAFAGCESLTNMAIPDSVKSIGMGAFYGCNSLTSMVIPSNATNINDYVFQSCTGLTTVTFSHGVKNICFGMFQYCSNLSYVTIPNSVTNIENRAFESCSSLTDVYYDGTEEQWKAISIGSYNTKLTNATIHFTEPEVPEVTAEVEGTTPQFTIDTSALDGTDNYAVITAGGKTERVEQADWVDGKITYDGVALKDLTQTVTMGLYDAEGTLLTEQSVSVYDALKARLDAETNVQKKAEYTAQLQLAAAAQKYFDHNTENLADKDLTETVGDMSQHRKDESSVHGKGKDIIYGTSCVLGNTLQMKIYFTANDKDVFINGEKVELTASPTEGYYFCGMNVNPADIFENVSIEVKDGDTVLATAKDSIASYCARLYAMGGEKNEALADAMLNYGVAAKAAEV